jgi:pimeloyl-[acyl-carrier protein] methyl ester esterase
MKLVLIPGLDGTGDLFASFVAAMGDIECQVIAYPPGQPMDYRAHEAHVRERLPRDEGFVLLAESFSGPVGVAIAAAPPPGLRALILCCTFASNPLPVFGSMSRLLAAFPAVKIPPRLFAPLLYAGHGTTELRRAHAQAMAKVSAATLRARVAAILAVDYRSLLPDIRVPLLYLQASRDRIVPRSALKAIQRVRADLEIATFDAPHFLLQILPSQVAAQVRRFVRALN